MDSVENIQKLNDYVTEIRNRFKPSFLKATFEAEDSDNTGFLEIYELESIARDFANILFEGGELERSEINSLVENILERFDENGDQKLEFCEYKKFMGYLLPMFMQKVKGFTAEDFITIANAGIKKGLIDKENLAACRELCRYCRADIES